MIRKKLSCKERLLWGGSLLVLTVVFFGFSRSTRMAWAASLAGASALIFCARAEPVGQALMDRIQYFVRDPVFPVRLLWGNDYLFGDERAHGSSIHGFLAASPL